MVERVKKLLSKDVEEIISTPLSIELLKCYSLIYLNGGQPRTCARSQRAYYLELKLTGLYMAQKNKKIMERTCKPNWVGNRFIWGDFYNHELITDEQAITLLRNKGLSESDFKKLPEGYVAGLKIEPKKNNNRAQKRKR